MEACNTPNRGKETELREPASQAFLKISPRNYATDPFPRIPGDDAVPRQRMGPLLRVCRIYPEQGIAYSVEMNYGSLIKNRRGSDMNRKLFAVLIVAVLALVASVSVSAHRDGRSEDTTATGMNNVEACRIARGYASSHCGAGANFGSCDCYAISEYQVSCTLQFACNPW